MKFNNIDEIQNHLANAAKYIVWPYVLLPFGFYFLTDLGQKHPVLFPIIGASTIILGITLFRISYCYSCLSDRLKKIWEVVLFSVSIGLHAFSSLLITLAITTNGYLSWSGLLACASWVGILEVISSTFHPHKKLAVLLAGVFGLIPSIYFSTSNDDLVRNFSILGLVYLSAIIFKIFKMNQYFVRETNLKLKLIEERDSLQSLIDLLPGKISWLDKNMSYKLVNKSLTDLVGIPKENFLGKKFGFMGTEKKASSFFEEFLMSNQNEFHGEVALNIEHPKRHLIHAKKINAKDGTEVVFVALDIEEYKRAQEQLEAERLKAIHSSRLAAVGEMAANIGHEIKNPLSVVNVGCYLIEKDLNKNRFDPVKTKERLKKMSLMVNQIVKIINGIRNMSRDNQDEDYCWLDVKSIISDPISLSANKFLENNVQFSVNLNDYIELNCQPLQIGQVILNLLNNSYEALSSQENRMISLYDKMQADGSYLISLSDNGPGVKNPEKLFTPFFTTKSKTGGTGIGLNISKKIIENHGGQLIYERKNGESVFTVLFPKDKVKNVKAVAA